MEDVYIWNGETDFSEAPEWVRLANVAGAFYIRDDGDGPMLVVPREGEDGLEYAAVFSSKQGPVQLVRDENGGITYSYV